MPVYTIIRTQSMFTIMLYIIGNEVVAYHDTTSATHTIRHSKCQLLTGDRCCNCSAHRYNIAHSPPQKLTFYLYCRQTLNTLNHRLLNKPPSTSGCSSHTNYRYMSTDEKINRLHDMHHQHQADQVQSFPCFLRSF